MNEEFPLGNSVSLISQRESNSKCQSFFTAIDIFAFLPVPINGAKISTKRSICGSFSLYVLFLAYVGFSLFQLFAHNIPRTNQYTVPLPGHLETETPPFAFAFMTGENLNESVQNKSFFEFRLEQVTINKDPNIPKNYTAVSHHNCNDSEVEWINSTIKKFLLCPDNPIQMRGLLYSSEIHKFSRLLFVLCNTSDLSASCAPKQETEGLISKGRIFLFLKKPADTDYATDESYAEGFFLRNYFVVMGFYNRAELQIQVQDSFIYPDWATSFRKELKRNLDLANEQFYISETPNELLVFQIWMRLAANINKSEIQYKTIVDFVSSWGALWGVFMTFGGLVFLRFNQRKFYSYNPEWDAFEKEIALIRSIKNRIRNPAEYLRNSES